MPDYIDNSGIYNRFMMEIRRRLDAARESAKQASSIAVDDQAEIACLHLRKALEMIAFASLAANRNSYEKYHGDFDRHWRAAKILEKLGKINSDFYPVPLTYISPGNYQNSTTTHLTRERFAYLYDVTSEVIHTWNPYRAERLQIDLKRPLEEWIDLIESLLSVHSVSIPDQNMRFICHLKHPSSGKTVLLVASTHI